MFRIILLYTIMLFITMWMCYLIVFRKNQLFKGDTGDVGKPGIKGNPGPPGPRGQSGDQGDRGPVGDKGSKGPPGNTGSSIKGLDGDPSPQDFHPISIIEDIQTSLSCDEICKQQGNRFCVNVLDWNPKYYKCSDPLKEKICDCGPSPLPQ